KTEVRTMGLSVEDPFTAASIRNGGIQAFQLRADLWLRFSLMGGMPVQMPAPQYAGRAQSAGSADHALVPEDMLVGGGRMGPAARSKVAPLPPGPIWLASCFTDHRMRAA
ncbi:MAG TPA: hypothetical protein VGS41_03510, partial [Chthonomonadales bacterium]|nr:hypothetical protein [Chthonomonadales bacterium]